MRLCQTPGQLTEPRTPLAERVGSTDNSQPSYSPFNSAANASISSRWSAICSVLGGAPDASTSKCFPSAPLRTSTENASVAQLLGPFLGIRVFGKVKIMGHRLLGGVIRGHCLCIFRLSNVLLA